MFDYDIMTTQHINVLHNLNVVCSMHTGTLPPRIIEVESGTFVKETMILEGPLFQVQYLFQG